MKASFDYVTVWRSYGGNLFYDGYVSPFGAIEALVTWVVPCCANLGYAYDNQTLNPGNHFGISLNWSSIIWYHFLHLVVSLW